MNADTNRPKMSAPTPETDARTYVPSLGASTVPADFARKLERERNEALIDRANGDIATMTINHYERLLRERDEAREKYTALATENMLAVNRLAEERDEAREDADHWKSEYEIVVARLCGVKHERDNGIIFEHEIIPKLERERDQARNENLGWKNKWKCAIEMAARAEVERDEARNAVPDGEWVAHEDYQKVHEKASRLLVAINKQLPIGCFILINTEYHALQNEIYGRNKVK